MLAQCWVMQYLWPAESHDSPVVHMHSVILPLQGLWDLWTWWDSHSVDQVTLYGKGNRILVVMLPDSTVATEDPPVFFEEDATLWKWRWLGPEGSLQKLRTIPSWQPARKHGLQSDSHKALNSAHHLNRTFFWGWKRILSLRWNSCPSQLEFSLVRPWREDPAN